MSILHTLTTSVTATAALLLVTGCGDDRDMGSERAPIREVVAVASGPAEFIAQVVLGPDAVERIDGSQWSPTWSPSDHGLASLATARRVLLMGNEFEPWAQRAGLPPSRTIILGDGLSPDALISTGTVTHTHGKGPAHDHGGLVPMTWTDPALLRAMVHGAAELLAGTVGAADTPAASSAAVERRRTFEKDLLAYEAALESLTDAVAGRRLFATSHGLEYIARAAGADLFVALLEPDAKGKTNDHAANLLESQAKQPGHAGVLVWLGDVDDGLAAGIEQGLGLRSVRVDVGRWGQDAGLLGRLTAGVQGLAAAVRAGQ